MEETQQLLSTSSKKKGKGRGIRCAFLCDLHYECATLAAGTEEAASSEPVKITLTFRKFIFDSQKRMLQ